MPMIRKHFPVTGFATPHEARIAYRSLHTGYASAGPWGPHEGPQGPHISDELVEHMNIQWRGDLTHWREVRPAQTQHYGRYASNAPSRESVRRTPFLIYGQGPVDYWRWRNQFIEGPPRATFAYTSAQLSRMGMVGLYFKPGE